MTDQKREQLTEIILASIAVAGVLTLAIVMPNIMKLYPYLFKDKRGERRRYYIQSRITTLIARKYLHVDEKRRITLTPRGEHALKQFRIQQWLKRQKKTRWDGKWRIVAFDIHERSRKQRDLLRVELKEAGFIQLQRSMWVTPHDCADFITLLKTDLYVGRSVLYIVADSIEEDYALRKQFGFL